MNKVQKWKSGQDGGMNTCSIQNMKVISRSREWVITKDRETRDTSHLDGRGRSSRLGKVLEPIWVIKLLHIEGPQVNQNKFSSNYYFLYTPRSGKIQETQYE